MNRLLSIVLVSAFISFDISWAYPEHSPNTHTLATQSILQEHMMNDEGLARQEAIFADMRLRTTVFSIAKTLLEDSIPIRYLEPTLRQELKSMLPGGIDLGPAGVTLKNGVVEIKYKSGGKNYSIFVALKENHPSRQGLDKYAIKIIPKDETPAVKSFPAGEEAPLWSEQKLFAEIERLNETVYRGDPGKGIPGNPEFGQDSGRTAIVRASIQKRELPGIGRTELKYIVKDGRLLGYVIFGKTPMDLIQKVGNSAYIYFIAVHPDARGQDIGTGLFGKVIDFALQNKISRVATNVNKDSLYGVFYDKMKTLPQVSHVDIRSHVFETPSHKIDTYLYVYFIRPETPSVKSFPAGEEDPIEQVKKRIKEFLDEGRLRWVAWSLRDGCVSVDVFTHALPAAPGMRDRIKLEEAAIAAAVEVIKNSPKRDEFLRCPAFQGLDVKILEYLAKKYGLVPIRTAKTGEDDKPAVKSFPAGEEKIGFSAVDSSNIDGYIKRLESDEEFFSVEYKAVSKAYDFNYLSTANLKSFNDSQIVALRHIFESVILREVTAYCDHVFNGMMRETIPCIDRRIMMLLYAHMRLKLDITDVLLGRKDFEPIRREIFEKVLAKPPAEKTSLDIFGRQFKLEIFHLFMNEVGSINSLLEKLGSSKRVYVMMGNGQYSDIGFGTVEAVSDKAFIFKEDILMLSTLCMAYCMPDDTIMVSRSAIKNHVLGMIRMRFRDDFGSSGMDQKIKDFALSKAFDSYGVRSLADATSEVVERITDDQLALQMAHEIGHRKVHGQLRNERGILPYWALMIPSGATIVEGVNEFAADIAPEGTAELIFKTAQQDKERAGRLFYLDLTRVITFYADANLPHKISGMLALPYYADCINDDGTIDFKTLEENSGVYRSFIMRGLSLLSEMAEKELPRICELCGDKNSIVDFTEKESASAKDISLQVGAGLGSFIAKSFYNDTREDIFETISKNVAAKIDKITGPKKSAPVETVQAKVAEEPPNRLESIRRALVERGVLGRPLVYRVNDASLNALFAARVIDEAAVRAFYKANSFIVFNDDKIPGILKVLREIQAGLETPAVKSFPAGEEKLSEEAKALVASTIILARRAKQEGQKLIIGIDTGWIPGYNAPGSFQRQAITPLVTEIESLPEKLRSMGLDNVVLVRAASGNLASSVGQEAKKTNTRLSNVVILAAKKAIDSDEFAALRAAPGNEKPFLAAIDPANLERWLEENKDSHKELHAGLLEMLSLALELAVGKEPPETPLIASYDRANRIVILLPRAIPMDYEKELRDTYKAETVALAAA